MRRGKQTIYDDEGERIFPNRDVRTVQVERTHEERQLYQAVTEYVKNVYNRSEQLNQPAVGFAMALMQKRLVSSVGAIKSTLSRRLADLVDQQSAETSLSEEASAYLEGQDLDEEDKQQAEQELSTLTVTESDAQLEEEIETLRDLVSIAEGIPVDSKAQKVRRYIQQLLEEQPNEKILLFTEYRDSLDYLLDLVKDEPWADEILVIHGGVNKEDRARIEDEFNFGQSRLLFATDAASEGIDLQESCHIQLNLELPWVPSTLEQRIGRLHRYGQDKEVKVWNFTFEETREGEIFEMLQNKVDNIRGKLGNTADVLGMLDDINVDSLIIESIQNDEPTSATKEELEELINERQRTLEEWYERSLIDTTTFDQESRNKIQEVMDQSEDVYGSEADIRGFFEQGVSALGGSVESAGTNLFRADLPDSLRHSPSSEPYGPFTFNREFAMDHDDIEYISPDAELVQKLMRQVLDNDQGTVGLKLLPFVEDPGITYNYRVRFEDGTGEVIREEITPVFVDVAHRDPQERLGQRVIEGDSLKGSPADERVRMLLETEDEMRSSAERYISQRVDSRRNELQRRRKEETQQELDDLEAYAEAERERIETFIAEYERKAEAGTDMDIAIRKQRNRLSKLEERIEKRRNELRRKAQIISVAPEVENLCLTLPIN